ncbi:DUF2304 domain-containing protein [Cellulomonas sp.]|uniref:DUF2304 domain-containing protein n=1 Tax=Cellulomonas sp. TaxID=40001 RepID=UPI001B20E091|nr:DUF2304 domain-containing protein [Cellulomonas sp.]MBO9556663.1 DUF2304 domain-containing protein [Cellulomonas sp.]
MSGYGFALGLSALTLVVLLWLLRARRLREKYAAIWIVLAVSIVVLGAFPGLVFGLARFVGVETPANLLFASSLVVLLLVCIQLSTELSGLEEETRTLAEEHALLARRVDVLEAAAAAGRDGVDLSDNGAAPPSA